MTLSHSRALLLLAALLCIFLLCVREFRVLADGNVHVRMLNVGQGDAILITGPTGKQILVDGGPDTRALEGMATHMSLFDRTIDVLVLTHPHLDHVASFPDILRRYSVGVVLISGAESHTGKYKEMLTMLRDEQIPVIIADSQNDIDMGDGILLDVLWPPEGFALSDQWKDLNDTSIVFTLHYGDQSMLFTGDMETLSENLLLASGADVRADVLKVGHHGSKGSSSSGFLLAVNPERAIISAGEGNSYNHPHTELLDRLKAFNIPYEATLWDGEIEVVMDGS